MTANPRASFNPASPPALRYLGGGGFDDRQWRWALRDSGLLATLKPAAVKLAFLAYALADAQGELDLPQRWAAAQIGVAARWIRSALAELEHAQLIQCLGPSHTHPQVRRYCLTLPPGTPAAAGDALPGAQPAPSYATPGTLSREAQTRPTLGARSLEAPQEPPPPKPPWGSKRRTCTSPPPDVYVPTPGRAVHQTGRAGAPQRDPERKSRRKTRELVTSPSLWESPVYDRAAAAALCALAGFDGRQAHGLVCQYRPTRRQVLHVLANAFAWRRADRLGQANGRKLRDLRGFVVGELRRGSLSLDDRVLAFRRQRRQQAAARQRAAEDRRRVAQSHAEGRAPLPGAAADLSDDGRLAQAALDLARQRRQGPGEAFALLERQGWTPQRWAAAQAELEAST